MIEGIEEDIEKRLRRDQEKKDYKDAGERIGGSKKERAAYKSLIRLSDLYNLEMDAVTAAEMVVKEKVFPKIVLEEEMDRGVESGAAFLKTEIRTAFPNKPKGYEAIHRRAYIGFVERLYADLFPCISVDDIESIARRYQKLKGSEFIEIVNLGVNANEENREELDRRYPDYKIARLMRDMFGATFYNLFFNRSDAAKEKWTKARLYCGFSKEDSSKALAIWKERYAQEQQVIRAKAEAYKGYDYGQLKEQMKHWRGVSRDLDTFRKQSISFYENKVKKIQAMIDNPPKIYQEREEDWSWSKKEKSQPAKKSELRINEGVTLDFIKRVGGLEIKDVSEHEIIRLFGFKAVEFGNYVKDKEAEQHIRHFLGSCADLFEILNFHPAQVNSARGLSISFGSRGSGKAFATYTPSRKIINITKSRGDGAVAHEWAHYLDNLIFSSIATHSQTEIPFASLHLKYLGEGEIKQALENLMTFIYKGDGQDKRITQTFSSQSVTIYPRLKGDSIEESLLNVKARYPNIFRHNRKYLRDQQMIFGYLARAFELPSLEVELVKSDISNFYMYSSKLNKYWREPYELFARGFETYVLDKLEQSGRSNNYLVSGAYFDHPAKVYPYGEERKILFQYYDLLMRAVKKQLEIKDFVPFTEVRTDEYIEFEKDAIKGGLIVRNKHQHRLQRLEVQLFKIIQKHAA